MFREHARQEQQGHQRVQIQDGGSISKMALLKECGSLRSLEL